MLQQADFDRSIESYTLAAQGVNGLLLPVAAAWLAAWRHDSTLVLYSGDGLHPSVAASYLAALVLYSALYDRSPVGVPPRVQLASGVTMGVSPQIAAILQAAAAEVLAHQAWYWTMRPWGASLAAMSLVRTALLRASRSEWLASQFKKHEFTRRAVKNFLPGEDLGAALDAAGALAAEDLGSLITNLGERVTTRGEAAAVREHYLGALDAIHARSLPTQLSIKLTHLGLEAGRDACASDVAKLAAHASSLGSFVWLDMEESHYVDATMGIFREVRASYTNVGLCLQAYLHRTPMDLETLLPLQPAIRLVKGAYREPAARALARRHDIDAAYLSLGRRLLDQAARGHHGLPVFGTHDTRLIESLRMHANGRRLPPHAYEVHMLYGIATATQRGLAAAGTKVRTLISYGTNWFPWYMRRLAERPANMWFVVQNAFR